ncbi:MAG TPA: DUF4405 domain-containing protein [Planctomycetota bacterium]|nr:DUF4405 domain-containing protein [Planctomycetota bacterium]
MPRNKLHLVVDVLAYLAMTCLAGTGLLMLYRLPPGSGSRGILGYSRHQWGTIHFYIALSLIGLVALHVILHWKWVTNSLGALVRRTRRAGAGAGGALLLIVLGLAGAGVMAAPWLLPVGAGSPCDDEGQGGGGKGKGYRGGKAASACDTCTDGACPSEAPAAKEQAAEGESPCEKCDGACPAAAKAGAAQEHAEGRGPEGVKGSTTLAEAAAEAGVPFERIVAELKLPAGTSPDESLGRLRKQHGFTMEDVRAAIARLKQTRKDNP